MGTIPMGWRHKWFQPRDERDDFDPIGPATQYASGRGAYAPGAAPAEQHELAWNAPTMIEGAPLLTLGQQVRAREAERHDGAHQ